LDSAKASSLCLYEVVNVRFEVIVLYAFMGFGQITTGDFVALYQPLYCCHLYQDGQYTGLIDLEANRENLKLATGADVRSVNIPGIKQITAKVIEGGDIVEKGKVWILRK